MKKLLLAALFAATAISPALAEAPTPVPAEDALFKQPYVDIDEWRDGPVRHRYVHGGFTGTDMRFSFYMPEKAQYQGRFFQYVTPVPDNENLAQTPGDDKIGFSISSGGYFIETNGGGVTAVAGPAFGADPKIGAFRANAAAAMYSRKLAAEMYGPHRTYGYLYGGSGGGYRTLGSMENTTGIWDGAVPFVLGSPMAAPNVFAVRMHAMRILKDKFPQIVDAMDAGGTQNPYAGLNEDETAALREVTRMGFPINSWFGHKTMGVHAFTALYQGMVMADPGYFEDFWTKAGYMGFDQPGAFKDVRLQYLTKVKLALSEDQAVERGLPDVRIPGTSRGTAELAWKAAVGGDSARPVALLLEGTPPDVGFMGGDLFILSGEAKGKRLALRAVKNDLVTLGVVDNATLAKLKPGDDVRVDNSNFLAAQTYHRHQVPDASYKVWDQFRATDGKPLYPQRKINLGPMFAMGAAGTVPTGKFNGKVIVIGSMLDREAFAWQSDWYRQRFEENYGKDAGNRYRLWFTENALHGASEFATAPTRVVNYTPMLQQALRDLAAWVEKGTPPPANSGYRFDDGQIILADTAADRKSIQPVVTISASGRARAVTKVGKPVRVSATITVPPGTGKIISAAWDFDGSGNFAEKAKLPTTATAKAKLSTTHSFDAPGTYFVTIKVESERNGDVDSPYARIPNLARVRVVVR
jgi:hypothetical protein